MPIPQFASLASLNQLFRRFLALLPFCAHMVFADDVPALRKQKPTRGILLSQTEGNVQEPGFVALTTEAVAQERTSCMQSETANSISIIFQ